MMPCQQQHASIAAYRQSALEMALEPATERAPEPALLRNLLRLLRNPFYG